MRAAFVTVADLRTHAPPALLVDVDPARIDAALARASAQVKSYLDERDTRFVVLVCKEAARDLWQQRALYSRDPIPRPQA